MQNKLQVARGGVNEIGFWVGLNKIPDGIDLKSIQKVEMKWMRIQQRLRMIKLYDKQVSKWVS